MRPESDEWVRAPTEVASSSPVFQPAFDPQDFNHEETKLAADETRGMIQKLRYVPAGQIPVYLPMYRGLHICSRNFVKHFRESIKEDSNRLAGIVDSEYKQGNDNNHNSFQLERNRLFNRQLLELLYSQPFISEKIRYEGSFSYARAAAQLRQFYACVIDPDDDTLYNYEWKAARGEYQYIIEQKAGVIASSRT